MNIEAYQKAIADNFIATDDASIYDVYGKRNLSKYETLENEELERINLNHMEVEREIYETFKMYSHKYLDLYINYNEPFIKKKH